MFFFVGAIGFAIASVPGGIKDAKNAARAV